MTTLRALLRCLVLLAAGVALHAMAQDADPPGRVAYLNSQQGTLSMSPAGEDSWYDTIPNRPLTQGDRLWADNNARAELYVGDTALRMGGQTDLAIDELNDQALRVTVQQGRLQLRVRSELDGQRIELGTGNLALVVRAPGDYRVLVDPQNDSTQVMVAQGSVTVYGENGQVQELRSRQQAVFIGRELASGGTPQALSADFEQWLAARSRAEDQSRSARYVSREVPGYQQLDQYGEWQNVPEYGAVWYPSQVAPGWAPYSDGYWITVAPWGLTWVDRAPWGFAPFHYGRWKRFGPRWGWVPGHRHVRPVYSPALVAFVGGAPGANFTVHGGRPAVGWFPLAPGDHWRPGYRVSDRYIERANGMAVATRDTPAYANRALPNAVTVVPADRFGRGGPISRRDHVRPPDPRVLNQARVLDRPPVPAAGVTSPGGAAAGGMGFVGRRSSAVPPEVIQARQQPEWRQRIEQGQRDQRDQARGQERAARDQQEAQRRALQEQEVRGRQRDQQQQLQMQTQQQEQARRQAEQQQQQENMQRQSRQQEQQARRQAEQQQFQAQRQGQQQEQMRRQQEQQQAQQEGQARRQAEQQQFQAQRLAQHQQQQQEQMRHTRLAVDSIFMMPQLGVLAEVHPQAATEVFEKDCLIWLGTCVASKGAGKEGKSMFTIELERPGGKRQTIDVGFGELKLVPLPLGETVRAKITPSKGGDVGAGPGKTSERDLHGGVVGLVLDGRGRPLALDPLDPDRVRKLREWTIALDAYPQPEPVAAA